MRHGASSSQLDCSEINTHFDIKKTKSNSTSFGDDLGMKKRGARVSPILCKYAAVRHIKVCVGTV